MKRLFIYLFLGIFLTTCINAVPPFQASTGTMGYDLKLSQFDALKKGEDFSIHVHVFNKSNGVPLSNISQGGISCFAHAYDQQGRHILNNAMEYEIEGPGGIGEWSLTADKGNFSTIQELSLTVGCNNSITGGWLSATTQVTSTGHIFTSSMAILYVGCFFILILLFLLNIYAIPFLPKENPKTEEGDFMSVNNLKHLRTILIGTAFILFGLLTFIVGSICEAFLQTQLVARVLFAMFRIESVIAPIIVILVFLKIINDFFQDQKIKEFLRKGF